MTRPSGERDDRPVQGVVAVIPRGAQLLVIRRSQLVRAPGTYCFPGGGVADGEDEPAALIRELREELNVDVNPLRRLWTNVTPWSVSLAWWLAELATAAEPDPNPLEVESVHWLMVEQIRDLPELLRSNHDFLDAHARGEFGW
jgi:8-oxo-dGTP pyrophosphatase MutT (NUDIX family)